MYRLLKLRSIGLDKVRGMSLNSSNETIRNVSKRTCTLCNQLHYKTNYRFQSTNTNPNVASKKLRKKRTKMSKKYAEMLVVTDSSTSEFKAKVQNLRPNDVKMFALTDFNLNELYKLKDLTKKSNKVINEHTYNNLTDVNNFPNLHLNIDEVLPSLKAVISHKLLPMVIDNTLTNDIDLEGETGVEILDVLKQVKPNAAFQPEIVEEEEIIEEEEETKLVEEPKKRPKLYDLKAREEMLSRTLAAYIEVCVSLKAPQRGLKALQYIRYRVTKDASRTPQIKNLAVYNALLRGFASKGDFYKIKEVLGLMKEECIALNVQSYAAIFECLGRVNCQDNHLKQIRIYSKEAKQEGFTFDRILNDATFLHDQRVKVLNAMKAIDANYVPIYEKPDLQFENRLVNALNHDDQLHGLQQMKKSNDDCFFTGKEINDLIKRQMEIEENVFVTVKSIQAKPEPTEETIKYRKSWSEHLKLWEQTSTAAFNRDLAALSAQRSSFNLEPYMRSIPIRDFIAIIMDEAQKIAQGSETYSPTVYMLHRDLGTKVYARYKVLKKQKAGVLDKMFAIHSKYCANYADSHQQLDVLPGKMDNLNPRQKWQWAEYSCKSEGSTITTDHQEWVPPVLQSIGKFLYNIVMHDLKIDVNVMRNNSKHKNYLPAFYTIFRHQGRIVKEEIKPHPILSKLYRASSPETLRFPAYELPMMCPPVPWISVNTGGYLVAPCEVIRLPSQATMQKQILQETRANNLYPSLDALNQLAAVPWKVNKQIFQVILEVFKNGGSAKLDVPEEPSSVEPPPSVTTDMDKSQKFAIFKQKLQYRRKKAEMYSLWCDCLYRLSLADHFKENIFWLPHNMDFRGRVYPVPPHLNHLGSDLARAMLVFAEARPLGPNGLDWLKLHLINLTGLLKREKVKDRLIYADSIMDKILDSADNPLTGDKWWADSEEPWQTLACCMEITNAHRSTDPEKFMSHFPVHQDGSCNGLQHYAALGRDSAGAFSVNLSPAPIPQDVYSAVAALVEERRKQDEENGIEIAKILNGFVKRKVIKQTVMTTVYGVTRFGARLQIARQLKDLDDFPKDSVWAGSSYLTGRTFDSLRTMFTSTREIQDWFTDCARMISSVCGQNVEWTTPLGLPVVQPYFRYKRVNSNSVYEPFQMDKYEKPNVMKQKNAFPPNFIHSLDSSHMMLTSLHCERAGITFVSVHDCYWTHPSTVHIMNKICRQQFVALHSEPILENLSNFLSDKYSYHASEIMEDGSVTELTKRKLNRVLRKLPKTGKFNIREVLDSVYFFS